MLTRRAPPEASASLYSIIETAKSNGLNLYWYLRHLFDLLPYARSEDDFRQLLPYVVTKDRMVEHLMEKWVN